VQLLLNVRHQRLDPRSILADTERRNQLVDRELGGGNRTKPKGLSPADQALVGRHLEYHQRPVPHCEFLPGTCRFVCPAFSAERTHDRIQANIQERGGDALHIERRILHSIDRAARIAGVALDSVDLKNRSPWGGKDLRQKAQAVGLEEAYLAVFGGMSHNVHGSWHDLYQFHLETDEEGAFTPSLEWGRPRPQPLFSLGHLALGAASDFLAFIGGEEAIGRLREQLRDLDARISAADQALRLIRFV
jgi:hypothetical protein